MARRKKAAVTEEQPEVTAEEPKVEPEVIEPEEVEGTVESFDYSGITSDILKSALGNIAHTVHPLPEYVDNAAAVEVIADLIVAGLVHDKAEPNLTHVGVEAARKL